MLRGAGVANANTVSRPHHALNPQTTASRQPSRCLWYFLYDREIYIGHHREKNFSSTFFGRNILTDNPGLTHPQLPHHLCF
mmetsp:Transcript_21997/g.61223  ORF Transcript_21997/g.61223 Transcript_21997/m.61223 type:complete len:81 (-) Transcript_21997:794-1036(-)